MTCSFRISFLFGQPFVQPSHISTQNFDQEYFCDNHLNNSFDLVQKLKDIQVDDDYILISLDVVSLFINIPIDLAIESVSKRWQQLLDK